MTTLDIPSGFEPLSRRSPLTEPWQPLYAKTTDKAVIIGLRLAKPHTNSRGLIHGGLIAALADAAMGYSCAHQMGNVSSLVTIGLAVDFIGSAKIGQWLTIESDVDQDRQHDLLRAMPGHRRRCRDRARQCDVPGGAEGAVAVIPGRDALLTLLRNPDPTA